MTHNNANKVRVVGGRGIWRRDVKGGAHSVVEIVTTGPQGPWVASGEAKRSPHTKWESCDHTRHISQTTTECPPPLCCRMSEGWFSQSEHTEWESSGWNYDTVRQMVDPYTVSYHRQRRRIFFGTWKKSSHRRAQGRLQHMLRRNRAHLEH